MLLRLTARSIRRFTTSSSSLPLLSSSSFCTVPTMAANHPKDEAYLSAVIPKRIKLFEQIQANQLENLKSLPHDPIKVTLPDGNVKEGKKWETTPMDIAAQISKGLANSALISAVDDVLWDMNRPLEGDCKLELFKFDSDKGRDTLWHSSAHILGQALEQEYGCQLCIGPCTTRGEGFYYDGFYGELGLSDNHFPSIEAGAAKAAKEAQPFERIEVTKDQALEMFSENNFKVELINGLPADMTITVYRCGPLVDLCRGPHIPNTSFVKAFKCLRASSAYWKGDKDRESLQRVYGISYPDQKQLKKYLQFLEEAKKYDHRLLGQKQELFFSHQLSPGSYFFLPLGTRVYNRLMDFIKNQYWHRGYTEVITPNMYNMELWQTSGHADNYKDNMFTFNIEKQEFGLKPMNCPGHCLIFQHRVRSYRELPMRLADFGVLHRNEASGALSGLTRVRRFQQDDAHIFCTTEQVKGEVQGVLEFIDYVYKVFGFTYELKLSTRPEKYLGDLETWDKAEADLKEAIEAFGKPLVLNEGDGAFYGPKIDITVSDAMNRKFHRVGFLINLASLAKKQSFCRAGFMALVQCIVSTAYVVGGYGDKEMGHLEDKFSGTAQESSCGHLSQDDMTHILDVLKFVAESSRQHFNHKYRIRVYQKVLETAASVVNPCNVPLGTLLQFVSAIPREFTDHDGLLRKMMLEWLQGCNRKTSNSLCTDGTRLLASLYEYLKGFTSDNVESFDDEDLEAWDSQTKRWARVFFLMINKEEHLTDIIMFVQNNGLSFFQEKNHLKRAPAKFLIFILSMLLELQNMQDGISELSSSVKSKSGIGSDEQTGKQIVVDASSIKKKFAVVLLSILKELIPFADSSCSIFWSHTTVENGALPGSVIGKLGGPSQRRLSVPTTTAVLEAVLSVKTIGLISSYCAQFTSGVGELKLALAFFWKFTQHTISSQICNSEAAAEIYLAAFEALASVLNAFVSLCSAGAFNLLENDSTLLSMVDGEFWLQVSVPAFVRNINHLLTAGVLVRSRRAVLLSWKWLCVESLLSVMHILDARRIPEDRKSFFSDDTVKSIFQDIVESLENAGEGSALPMLKSVRLALGILASGKSSLDGFSGVDTQTMWQLVKSCWILHISCKKRRVAPIAALLSSVLHSSLFSNKDMHITEDEHGPLKWFVEKVLEEGQKSPRTIRLAALHLSGLWLMYPRTIKYYIKELRLLTLYGSVAFDEDFEAELSDNNDARTEVSLLAKSPDPELTELFINTELYARVSVAGLFQKLANLAYMVEPASQNQDCQDALVAGKLFLLELLDAAVHDKDLAKELYKKYSAIHRRKIRAWQMICIMSRFVCNDIVGQVMDSVHICLHRNNLPAVRQYLETFAINIYLKFPALVKEQLVPILKNYDSKAQQALSSYVFVAANVILHAEKIAQQTHLRELLPPILPLLTSHHHSLRGFAQLLVHRVLFRLFPPVESTSSHTISLEKLSFENLKSYLDKNPDCSRLRASMEGFLDAYDPSTSATPAGVFVNRVEESEFECVPTCLMDNVLSFLNDVREDLRASMAKDVVTIKNEGFKIDEEPKRRLIMSTTDEERLSEPSSLDFQRKITLSKHEKQDASSTSVLRNGETYKRLFEMEKEDELVTQLLRSRSMEVERLKSGRQSLILVASLVDRIPNLAGLARTCEVFKASSLAVADASIIHDKQFQLISVTAEKWVPIMEVPVNSLKLFLEKKKREGFSILGLEQTANSVSLDKYQFPKKTVLVLGREKEGIPVDIIHILDACIEIPQLGVVRSLNVHVSGAIALWEYTRQQRI